MKDKYKVLVKFKNNQLLEITTETETNPREIFEEEWKTYKKEGAIAIGDYIFDVNEVAYIKVEGGQVEKRSRRKVHNSRKKVK